MLPLTSSAWVSISNRCFALRSNSRSLNISNPFNYGLRMSPMFVSFTECVVRDSNFICTSNGIYELSIVWDNNRYKVTDSHSFDGFKSMRIIYNYGLYC